MDTHLRVLGKGNPMATNMTGFKSFQKSLRPWALDKSRLSIEGANIDTRRVFWKVFFSEVSFLPKISCWKETSRCYDLFANKSEIKHYLAKVLAHSCLESFKPFLASTLPMLRLLSSKVQGPKAFWKSSKPCHVGIHWIALSEYSQISTHVPGFQSFFRYFASLTPGVS